MTRGRSLMDHVATVNQRLANMDLVTRPFPHFTLDRVFDDDLAEDALTWFERDAPWKCQSRDFYLQHGVTRLEERLKDTPAHAVASPEMIETIRQQCERIFGTPLRANHAEICAHRMVPGHRIGVHNDQPSGGTDTHRFVVNLNRGFEDRSGGQLVLFDREDLAGSAMLVRPRHNSGVAMEFSARSWHCVEEITSGVRYSLLYSFWPALDAQTSASEAKAESSMNGHTVPDGLSSEEADDIRRALQPLMGSFISAGPGGPRKTLDTIVRWGCDRDTCKSALFQDVVGGSIAFSSLSQEVYGNVRDILGERAVMLAQMMDGLDSLALLRLRQTGAVIERECRVAVGDMDQRAVAALFWARVLDGRDAGMTADAGFDVSETYRVTAECLTPRAADDITRRFANLQVRQM